MPTSEERLKVLKMVEEGKITAEEGARLLAALARGKQVPQAPTIAGGARWLRVRVTDLVTGRTRVSINVPISLVNIGLKMGARFAPELRDEEWGLLVQALQNGELGRVVDVTDEDDGERVEVFLE